MKTMRTRRPEDNSVCCAFCKLGDNSPDKYGEVITIEDKLTVHYLCLLMSSGLYQRGEEEEGIHGFLVDDIKQEVRRSSRLRCIGCKKTGASIGCYIRNCRKTVHFPCGKGQQFIFQFTGAFPAYCKEHSPSQLVSCDVSLPQSCSVCLDSLEPLLSYSVLRCPCCLNSWFHRDCVQRQAHSAGLFFFRCTLCSNKEQFQQEMLRMGIHIPERDASWELEEDAYGELLEEYQHCDARKCVNHKGRNSTSKTGWFEIMRCKMCGSRGTHRKCSSLKLCTSTWVCEDCSAAVQRQVSLPRPRLLDTHQSGGQRKDLKRRSLFVHPVKPNPKERPSLSAGSPAEMLQALARQFLQDPPCSPSLTPKTITRSSHATRSSPSLTPKTITRSSHATRSSPSLTPSAGRAPAHMEVLVSGEQALSAALELVKSGRFRPAQPLSVRFTGSRGTTSPRSPGAGDTRHFLQLLVRQIQSSRLFEGPEGAKNLALDSHALREDIYYDVGCLLALSLVHGGPPLGFFSRALYQCLFNHPQDTPLTLDDMGHTHFTHKVKLIEESRSVEELRAAMQTAAEYLEVAGCMRAVSSLADKKPLVDDIINFHLITRMQLPFQRFREGLKTLGVFDQVCMFPGAFLGLFCGPAEKLSAGAVAGLFAVLFSDQEEVAAKEASVVSFWRCYLEECEVGRCASCLEDVLVFVTAADKVPAAGFHPAPSLSFLHPLDPTGVAFPASKPSINRLYLPVVPTYETFKKHLEYAICHLTVMQNI